MIVSPSRREDSLLCKYIRKFIVHPLVLCTMYIFRLRILILYCAFLGTYCHFNFYKPKPETSVSYSSSCQVVVKLLKCAHQAVIKSIYRSSLGSQLLVCQALIGNLMVNVSQSQSSTRQQYELSASGFLKRCS